jgi:hypothetical protein
VTRIDIIYGGKPYSVAADSLDTLQTELSQAALTANPYWLKVNTGEGRIEDAYLLIAPGIPIAIINVSPNGPRASTNEHDVEHDDTFVLDVI